MPQTKLPFTKSDLSKEEIISLYSLALEKGPNLPEMIKKSDNHIELLTLHTLALLSRERLQDLIEEPAAMWRFTVTRAQEALALHISTDEILPEEIRKKFEPKPTGGGINTSYFLQICPLEQILEGVLPEDQNLNSSSVYKPRHQTMGSVDSPIRYGAPESRMLIGEEQEKGILLRTRHRKLPVMTLLCSKEELPKIVTWDEVEYRKYQGAKVGFDPGSETLAEALFFELARYIDSQAKSLALPLYDGFGVPRTTIEQFHHPLFGPHHTVGSRQDYIENAKHFASRKAAKEREKLKSREILKIAFLDLLAANIDRHEGNLLIRKSALFHVDAGYAFPSFRGATAMELSKVVLSWHTQACADKAFPQDFATLADGLDPLKLCAHLEEHTTRYQERFPEENFQLKPGQELVLHGTLHLLKLGTEHKLTPKRMANFLFHQPILDRNDEPVLHEKEQKLQMGGELWPALMLACLKAGHPYKSDEPLPFAVLQQVPQMVAGLITREIVLRHLTRAMVDVRKTTTPMEFLQRVFSGEFDALP